MTQSPQVPSQAEAMLRRVSPEGRARALKEQRARQRRTMKLLGRCLLATILVALLMAGINAWVTPLSGGMEAGALVVLIAAWIAIAFGMRERPATVADLGTAPLDALPAQTADWLEGQRPALPAPAARLADDIAAKLAAMPGPLAKLDPREPAADAVRKLLAHELPGLVDRYLSVPAPLRGEARDGFANADAQLVHGLGVVDAEVARMTSQLARGAFDELATQSRFLELKYSDGETPG